MRFKLSDVKCFPSIRALEGKYRVVLTLQDDTTITRDIGREEIIQKLFGDILEPKKEASE